MSQIYSNLVKSFAYLNILIELSKGKKLTGYDIVVHVRKFGLEVSPGTIYHQLHVLSELGFIRGEKQKTTTKYARRGAMTYEMTEKGMEVFEGFKKKWKKPLEYAYKNLQM